MPIFDEDTGGPTEPCIIWGNWGCRSPKGKGHFWWLSGHSKALAILAAPVIAASLQKRSFNHQ